MGEKLSDGSASRIPDRGKGKTLESWFISDPISQLLLLRLQWIRCEIWLLLLFTSKALSIFYFLIHISQGLSSLLFGDFYSIASVVPCEINPVDFKGISLP